MGYRMITRNCRECGRQMRPKHWPPDGKTVSHQGFGFCEKCLKGLRKRGELPSDHPRVPAFIRTGPCPPDQPCAICEDAAWLAETHAHCSTWAPRMGIASAEALQRRLFSHGRHELAHYLQPEVREEQLARARRKVRVVA